MKTFTQTETQKILIHENEVTIRFCGTPHEAVMFTGPFHSICEWRASYGKRTQVSLDLSPKPVFPVERLFGGYASETQYECTVEVRLDKKKNWIDDMFRQVCRPPGAMYLHEFFTNKSLLALSSARRITPYENFVMPAFPQKVLILPPVYGLTPEKSMVDPQLWTSMWGELCNLLLSEGYYCVGPKVEGGKTWNLSTLTAMRGHYEISTGNVESIIESILTSSVVVACQSEFSSLSSMLYVPTLTIYPNDPDWSRYTISGRGIPSYSCPMNQVQNVSADYVLQRLNQIQSSMLPVR